MSRRPLLLVLAVALATASTAGAVLVVRHRRSGEARPGADNLFGWEPTTDDARVLLLGKWEQALRAGKSAFCKDAESPAHCLDDWERSGGSLGVPRREPRVVASNAAQSFRWLTVCGTTGDGRAFEGDFVVTRDRAGGPVRIVLPVFWSRTRYGGVHDEGEPLTTEQQTYPATCSPAP